MDLAAQLEQAAASGRWFRLEPIERMQALPNFGIVDGTSQPLFLAAGEIAAAQQLLATMARQGQLLEEHEIACPRCCRCCWQYSTRAAAEEQKLGFLVDCPHCEGEWPAVSQSCRLVYRLADACCPPLGRRSRLSLLARRSAPLPGPAAC